MPRPSRRSRFIIRHLAPLVVAILSGGEGVVGSSNPRLDIPSPPVDDSDALAAPKHEPGSKWWRKSDLVRNWDVKHGQAQ